MSHVVIAPLIAVVVSGEWRQLLAGATVPSGVKSEDLDRLTREGYIREVESESSGESEVGDEGAQGGVKPPAKSGPGSGAAAWRDYAQSVGVTVGDAAERADIIKAVAAAGKPTE